MALLLPISNYVRARTQSNHHGGSGGAIACVAKCKSPPAPAERWIVADAIAESALPRATVMQSCAKAPI
jgi:hypothetical protein